VKLALRAKQVSRSSFNTTCAPGQPNRYAPLAVTSNVATPPRQARAAWLALASVIPDLLASPSLASFCNHASLIAISSICHGLCSQLLDYHQCFIFSPIASA
jgi:hypothetical protein